MRVTVCETPHEAGASEDFWNRLSQHCNAERTELLVLPEFAFLPPVWESETFDAHHWLALERQSAHWIRRLPELGSRLIIGSVPATVVGRALNRGFLWSKTNGLSALRSKQHLPNEPGSWEARWFMKGTTEYPAYSADELRFGLNICTELWDLAVLGSYARAGVQAIVTPRATAASTLDRWIALAQTAATRAGAFSLSSNRRHSDGSCGGVGWIIDPEGDVIALTSGSSPIVTRDIDLTEVGRASSRYPRYVFSTPY